MAEPERIPFTSSDIWLLLALSYAAFREPASLRDVIAAGDAINKAVFTPQELRRGFAKLIAAGWTEEREGRFALTAAAAGLLGHYRQSSVYDRWDAIERDLGATRGAEDSPGFEPLSWSYTPITDERVAAAFDEYSAAVERFIRKEIGPEKR